MAKPRNLRGLVSPVSELLSSVSETTRSTVFRARSSTQRGKLPPFLFPGFLGGFLSLLRHFLCGLFARFLLRSRLFCRGFLHHLLRRLHRSRRGSRRRRCPHPRRSLGRVLHRGLHPHRRFLGLFFGNAQFFLFRVPQLVGLDPQLFLFIEHRQFFILKVVFLEIHAILPRGNFFEFSRQKFSPGDGWPNPALAPHLQKSLSPLLSHS